MKRVSLFMVLMVTIGCASYSTARRPEAENIINAPIDTVWERTLEILPNERMTVKNMDKEEYFLEAKKHMTFWSWADHVSIRLIPKGESRTLMQINAGNVWGGLDMGHQGRMVRNVFDRIKEASEHSIHVETQEKSEQ